MALSDSILRMKDKVTGAVQNFFYPRDEYPRDDRTAGRSREGRRCGNGRHAQLCLTNPEVLRLVTSNVLDRIRKDPGALCYGVSQNDSHEYCECDTCKAVDEEEESHAGTMVRFVNGVP